jgi:hypothetical protein
MAKYEGIEHENMLKKKMTRKESYQRCVQLKLKRLAICGYSLAARGHTAEVPGYPSRNMR